RRKDEGRRQRGEGRRGGSISRDLTAIRRVCLKKVRKAPVAGQELVTGRTSGICTGMDALSCRVDCMAKKAAQAPGGARAAAKRKNRFARGVCLSEAEG